MSTRLSFTLPDGAFAGELYPNPVANQVRDLLPLELVFSDFNNVEKVARLDTPVTLHGVPEADAPQPGEIGYYAPTSGLVLYYGRVGRWPGLVRIGRFDHPLEALRDLTDGTTIRIEQRG